MNKQNILVIGHTGKTGKRVAKSLLAQGHEVRGVSRGSSIPFDWNRSETWLPALEGMESVYVTYQPDLAVPGADKAIETFVAFAKDAGIKHIVLLSGRGEEGAERSEKILIESGIEWNVVRASWFAQNFSEGFMLEGILTGEMVLPASDTLEPFIDVDDIAEVSVAALTHTALRNRLFEVTGPELLSFEDCMRIFSKVLGRDVQYIPVPLDAYLNELNDLGQPKDIQWLMNELFTVVFDGRNANISDGVEQALGRPATSFEDYVRKTAMTGIWQSPNAAESTSSAC